MQSIELMWRETDFWMVLMSVGAPYYQFYLSHITTGARRHRHVKPRMTTRPQQQTVVTPPASDNFQHCETLGATQSHRIPPCNGRTMSLTDTCI
jgi:hypothetical protein